MVPFHSVIKSFLLAIMLSAMGLLLGCGSKGKITTLYVATNGNNNWSGTLAAPSANGTDGPLQTIVAARDGIRAARKSDPLIWVVVA